MQAMSPADGSTTLRTRETVDRSLIFSTWTSLRSYAFVAKIVCAGRKARHSCSHWCHLRSCSEWQGIITWPQEETGSPIAFTQDGKSLYVQVRSICTRLHALVPIVVASPSTRRQHHPQLRVQPKPKPVSVHHLMSGPAPRRARWAATRRGWCGSALRTGPSRRRWPRTRAATLAAS